MAWLVVYAGWAPSECERLTATELEYWQGLLTAAMTRKTQ